MENLPDFPDGPISPRSPLSILNSGVDTIADRLQRQVLVDSVDISLARLLEISIFCDCSLHSPFERMNLCFVNEKIGMELS